MGIEIENDDLPENFSAAFLIQKRIDGLHKWLEKNDPAVSSDQKHLDEGSIERSYWHYGYLVALCDVRNLLLRITPDGKLRNIIPELNEETP